jgi:Ca2+-binding RTX toxin-like protein
MPTITGTPGADFLIGADTSDVVRGLGGGDMIDATPGNDQYDGGDGFDLVDYAVAEEGGADNPPVASHPRSASTA